MAVPACFASCAIPAIGAAMTTLLYGRPPAVFDPPGAATQLSPLIPGSTPLEDVAEGSVDDVMIYAPPGCWSGAMPWRWRCGR